MKHFVAVVFSALALSAVAEASKLSEVRDKLSNKGVLNLAAMTTAYLDCSFPPFPIPYGCWCGISVPFPPQEDPVDDFDQACKDHDYCYVDGENAGCSILDEYLWLYEWRMEGEGENKEIVCGSSNDFCQSIFCECDKSVTYALDEVVAKEGCRTENPGCTSRK